MKWKVKVIVRLREGGLNDPEGRVIQNALRNLGFKVENLRVPKYFEFELESEIQREKPRRCAGSYSPIPPSSTSGSTA